MISELLFSILSALVTWAFSRWAYKREDKRELRDIYKEAIISTQDLMLNCFSYYTSILKELSKLKHTWEFDLKELRGRRETVMESYKKVTEVMVSLELSDEGEVYSEIKTIEMQLAVFLSVSDQFFKEKPEKEKINKLIDNFSKMNAEIESSINQIRLIAIKKGTVKLA
jgi:uncharacterized protein YecA (UPF0149 family)